MAGFTIERLQGAYAQSVQDLTTVAHKFTIKIDEGKFGASTPAPIRRLVSACGIRNVFSIYRERQDAAAANNIR
jgi:hypothetical protein